MGRSALSDRPSNPQVEFCKWCDDPVRSFHHQCWLGKLQTKIERLTAELAFMTAAEKQRTEGLLDSHEREEKLEAERDRPVVDTFYLNKKRGQPGEWYGYVHIGDVTYKIDARHVGKGREKHFVGSVKRHLKADQQSLPLVSLRPDRVDAATLSAFDFNDPLPEKL